MEKRTQNEAKQNSTKLNCLQNYKNKTINDKERKKSFIIKHKYNRQKNKENNNQKKTFVI